MKIFEFWLNFVPKGPTDNKPALVQIMAWRQAIIWTKDDLVDINIYIYIYASLGVNVLRINYKS